MFLPAVIVIMFLYMVTILKILGEDKKLFSVATNNSYNVTSSHLLPLHIGQYHSLIYVILGEYNPKLPGFKGLKCFRVNLS